MFGKKRLPEQPRHVRASSPSQRPSTVFSYHANRSVRAGTHLRDTTWEQEEISRRRKRSWHKHVPGITVALIVFVVSVICLQLSSNARVETIDTGGGGGQLFLRDKKVYEQAAQKAFNSVGNSNKLTVNIDKISAELRHTFPELQVVTVSLPFIGNRPTVYIQPAAPRLILVTGGGMYVLDSSGRALISGNQVAKLDQLQVPVVNDQSGISIRSGNIALPRSAVAFITEVVGQLDAKHIKVSSLVLPARTTELHVRLEGVGYFAKFNLHGNAREEAGAFIAVKERLDAEHKMPREYIDVRVENKVYYR